MTEYEMQYDCLQRLRCQRDIQAVAIEISMITQSHYADICFVSHDKLIALELKLTYCEHAIEQAINYSQWGADKVYVVTPKKQITKKALARFQESGVGLLLYNAPVKNEVCIGHTYLPCRIDFSYPFEHVVEPTIKRPTDSDRYHDDIITEVKFLHEEYLKIARRACGK